MWTFYRVLAKNIHEWDLQAIKLILWNPNDVMGYVHSVCLFDVAVRCIFHKDQYWKGFISSARFQDANAKFMLWNISLVS